MSEKFNDIQKLNPINRLTIELDDPQQLRDLANRIEAAVKNRILPGEITVEITPSIEIRYNPNRNKSTIPFTNFYSNSRETPENNILVQ